jgi:hypothetical protein
MSLLVNQTFANQSAQLYIPVGQLEGINGVSVDNTDPEHPIISNTGTLSVTAGNGLSNVGTAENPILQNEGIIAITPGTGISVSPGQDATITNDGILTVTAGTGIDITPGQDPIITNDGIITISPGTSISIGGGPHDPIVNNPDFFKLSATNILANWTQTNTPEIVIATATFTLLPLTTYIHAFSFNNFAGAFLPLTGGGTYAIIARILPQGIGYPGVVSNLLMNQNDVYSRGIMQPFTTTTVSSYNYELRVVVTGAGTLRLQKIQTKVYQVS